MEVIGDPQRLTAIEVGALGGLPAASSPDALYVLAHTLK